MAQHPGNEQQKTLNAKLRAVMTEGIHYPKGHRVNQFSK
jgi:hypothetical protein